MINDMTGESNEVFAPMDVTAAIAQMLQIGTPRQSVGRWIPCLVPFIPLPALPAVFQDAFVHRRTWTQHYLAQAGVPRDQMRDLFRDHPELLDDSMTPPLMDVPDNMALFAGLDMFYEMADEDLNMAGLGRNIGFGLATILFLLVVSCTRFESFSLADPRLLWDHVRQRSKKTQKKKRRRVMSSGARLDTGAHGKREWLGWKYEPVMERYDEASSSDSDEEEEEDTPGLKMHARSEHHHLLQTSSPSTSVHVHKTTSSQTWSHVSPSTQHWNDDPRMHRLVVEMQGTTCLSAFLTVALYWVVAILMYVGIYSIKGYPFWDITHLNKDGTRFTLACSFTSFNVSSKPMSRKSLVCVWSIKSKSSA